MGRACGALLLVGGLLAALPARAETLASAYLGVSYTHPSTVRLRQEGDTDLRLRGVEWESRPLTPPLYYGLRLRYFPDDDESLGVMLDFVHDKVFAAPAQRVDVEGVPAGSVDTRLLTHHLVVGPTFRLQ